MFLFNFMNYNKNNTYTVYTLRHLYSLHPTTSNMDVKKYTYGFANVYLFFMQLEIKKY